MGKRQSRNQWKKLRRSLWNKLGVEYEGTDIQWEWKKIKLTMICEGTEEETGKKSTGWEVN